MSQQVEKLWVYDFDGVLVNVDDSFENLCVAAERIDPGLREKLESYNAERWEAGHEREIFNPSIVLGDKEDEVYAKYAEVVAEKSENYGVNPDAERRLKQDRELGRVAVILTFGIEKWQQAKIDASIVAAGFELEIIHTDEKVKPKTIEKWWNEETGMYEVLGYEARSIVGVGDEMTDFVGYDELPAASGYFKNPDGKKRNPAPDKVANIRSLDDILQTE